MMRALVAAVVAVLTTSPFVSADTLRVATFNIELTRDGPGLALRDIQKGDDPQVRAVSAVITRIGADVLALQGLDYDYGLETVRALNAQLAEPYDHIFALPTNRGLQSGVDMDGNGRTGDPADAQGFGRFYGQGAMALLSRFPIVEDAVQDFTDLIWSDLPGAQLPRYPDGQLFPTAEAAAIQRLSSSGHWVVPLTIGTRQTLSILTFHASPPVFDGPEDKNGLRNADEIALWMRLLDGDIGEGIEGPFVIAGSATLDPFDSEGRHEALRALLSDPRLQDPLPESAGGALEPPEGHAGRNALDTVHWERVGRLRVDYVLPSRDLTVQRSGVHWPAADAPGHDAAIAASRHRVVWADVTLPD